MVNNKVVQSEKGLRVQIKRNLNKEIHPATKPSIDFIHKILTDAYESGMVYDVKIGRSLKKASPTILTCIGAAGVVATAVLAVKATPKADTIVAATYQMAKYIQLLAAQMGKKIPVPITVTNYIRLLASGGLGKSEKYLVDELQMMLSAMNVEAATVDCDCIEVLRGQQKEGL